MPNTQIPAARVPVALTGGLISREWYRFLYELFARVSLAAGYSSGVSTVTSSTTVTNTMRHLLCNGTLTLTLPAAADRDFVLVVTNIGTGTVTLAPDGAETISGDTSRVIKFQWTTMQLSPVSGTGWVII